MRRATMGGVVLAAALVLAACTGQDEEPAPTVEPTTTAAPSPDASPSLPDLESFTPPPPGLVDEDSDETVEPAPVPEWDEASRAAVIDAAEAAMTAFARPELDYETWWSELEPLLTPQAAENYAYVDPANIPARQVTGEAFLVNDTSAYVATVEVPTDAGRYHLVLNRKDAAAPWLVTRLTPVEEVE